MDDHETLHRELVASVKWAVEHTMPQLAPDDDPPPAIFVLPEENRHVEEPRLRAVQPSGVFNVNSEAHKRILLGQLAQRAMRDADTTAFAFVSCAWSHVPNEEQVARLMKYTEEHPEADMSLRKHLRAAGLAEPRLQPERREAVIVCVTSEWGQSHHQVLMVRHEDEGPGLEEWADFMPDEGGVKALGGLVPEAMSESVAAVVAAKSDWRS